MSEKGRNDKTPKMDVYVDDQGISTELMEQSAQHLIRILGEPDRMYKDHVFRMLLKDRHIALEVLCFHHFLIHILPAVPLHILQIIP